MIHPTAPPFSIDGLMRRILETDSGLFLKNDAIVKWRMDARKKREI
jgi:hypothetical protein